jgi:S-adenosylmethionine synthetase
VDAFNTGALPDAKIGEIVQELFDLRPTAIINTFDLRRPIYRQLAALGHIGRTDIDLPWERLNRVDELRKPIPVALF